MDGRNTITIAVELPLDSVLLEDRVALSAELRTLWAVDQVRRRRCGVGRGAEFAGMPRAAFMRLLGEHGVPVIDYPVGELRGEVPARP